MSQTHDERSTPGSRDGIDLLSELIRRQSITPDDAGCQELLATRLEAAGFCCEPMQFGNVSNLWARKGNDAPLLCFAGHTDVVPPGSASEWKTNPFEPVLVDGHLHGRGTADMKGGLVAMLLGVERFLQAVADHRGSIAFLITSDEEGPALDGTRKVMQTLVGRGDRIDYCVIGEPSSSDRLGDVIRVGRRGSMSGRLDINGVQGHVAYPQHADNPIHRFAGVLSAMLETRWDEGNDRFPPTSLQMVELRAGGDAPNVTPPSLRAEFNFRYSSEWNHESLQNKVVEILDTFDLDYNLEWILSGEPFLTAAGALIDAVVAAVSKVTGIAPELSTGGGTSDGRFIAPAGAQVVELGLVNRTVHKANECIKADDIDALAEIYRRVLATLLGR